MFDRQGAVLGRAGPNAEYGLAPVETVPEGLTSVLFVEGPEQAELVAALVASPEAAGVEHLMIGTTHDYVRPERKTPYDFSGAVAALRGAKMPALKRLSLGDMEKLFNGHGYYGRLGDITHVFEMAEHLEKLDLCGCFTLSRPVRHERLEIVIVDVDEIGVAGGPLSQETVTHLLSSTLPRLRELQLDLDEDEVQPYEVPEAFYAGNGFPALEGLAMDWLKPEAEARLTAWKAERGVRW